MGLAGRVGREGWLGGMAGKVGREGWLGGLAGRVGQDVGLEGFMIEHSKLSKIKPGNAGYFS